MSLTLPLPLDFQSGQSRPVASLMLLTWLTLLTLGVCMVASSSVATAPGLLSRHLLFVLVALMGMVLVMALPLQFVRRMHQAAIWVAIGFCILVLLPGVGDEAKGAKRWIRIGSFSLQASEVAKPLVLVYLAGYMERFGHLLGDRTLVLVKPLIPVGFVCALLVVEPDFGGAVVLGAAVCGVLFLGGARLRHFLLLGAASAVLMTGLIYMDGERMSRVTIFLDPWKDPQGDGYQLVQSLIAFGRGEMMGLGFGESVQKLFYLPEAHNDFIIAIVVEELGVAGVFAVMALFMILVFSIWNRARNHMQNERRFIGYLCYGIGLLFALQFLINVGVCTGALPTKGLTLPFISSGGNSLIVSCMLFALVLRGDAEAAAENTRRPHARRARRA
jgi:cell division protein FtsW